MGTRGTRPHPRTLENSRRRPLKRIAAISPNHFFKVLKENLTSLWSANMKRSYSVSLVAITLVEKWKKKQKYQDCLWRGKNESIMYCTVLIKLEMVGSASASIYKIEFTSSRFFVPRNILFWLCRSRAWGAKFGTWRKQGLWRWGENCNTWLRSNFSNFSDFQEPNGREYLQLALAKVLELQTKIKEDTFNFGNAIEMLCSIEKSIYNFII